MDDRRVARLRELASVVTKGPDAVRREFTMRIPAEPDRDADLVLSWAADEIETASAEVSRLEAVYKAAESVTETWYEGKALLESIHRLSAALSDAASGRRDTIPQQGACEQPENRTTLTADSRQKAPLADRLEERGFTKREDRACGSPYCDKRFSPRDATQAYCSVACEPPGPPSPPAGFSPRWGDDTEQPKLPNPDEKGQNSG